VPGRFPNSPFPAGFFFIRGASPRRTPQQPPAANCQPPRSKPQV
jgi:hypothetical protein